MEFTHLNPQGRARMVDVTEKDDTVRMARAQAYVAMEPATLHMIQEGAVAKGDVLAVAQVAGIMAAKRTADLIPMCHPLFLSGVDISFDFEPAESRLRIESTVKTTGKTGVEMEALTAVSLAALTVYDMCKAADRWMRIEGIELLEKSGGKSGHLSRCEPQEQGKVLAVCTSLHKGEKKTDVGEALLVAGHGLQGDAHGGPGHRQVSLLSRESIEKMRALGVEAGFGDFAENLTVEGIELHSLPVGTRIQVGTRAELEVTQIGKECHQGCAIRQQAGDCIMPREGIFARVLQGGMVKKGDDVEVLRR